MGGGVKVRCEILEPPCLPLTLTSTKDDNFSFALIISNILYFLYYYWLLGYIVSVQAAGRKDQAMLRAHTQLMLGSTGLLTSTPL